MKNIFALILACAMIFTLAACKGSSTPTDPETVPPTAETQPETEPATVPETLPETQPETLPETEPETEPVMDYTALTLEDCVKTGYEQVGSYTDDLGNDWAYSYYLPEITLDCPGAVEINETIRTEFQAEAEESLEYAAEGSSLIFGRMDYTAALKDGILSIMVQKDTMTDYIIYATYNLDLSTGKTTGREAVLAVFGMTETEFQEKVQARAEEIFLEHYGELTFPEDMDEFYNEQLEKTQTQNGDAPVFISPEGTLFAVINVYSLAGADYYPQTVEIR